LQIGGANKQYGNAFGRGLLGTCNYFGWGLIATKRINCNGQHG
jgi:hypothetical protein